MPYLIRPDMEYAIRANDIRIQGNAFAAYTLLRDAWPDIVRNMETARQIIRDNPALDAAGIAAQIALVGPNPPVPLYLAPAAQCGPGMHAAIKSYEDNVKEHQIAADKLKPLL